MCGGRGRGSDVLCGDGGSEMCVTLLGSVGVVVINQFCCTSTLTTQTVELYNS